MADQVKGSVTPLASMFPAEEAHKAAKRVQDTIAERQKELEGLRLFASDNTNLINLVQRLPDELSHDIMVPFGKAAFFPGRLIHTNEFLVVMTSKGKSLVFFGGGDSKVNVINKSTYHHTMVYLKVLLGEGYYAERTAKQTVEILQRRGKALEYQAESLKAVMTDLEAEAKFFDATANEAKEGLVEIREDYVEEPSTEREAELGTSTLGNMNITDEEYARIEARLDELEKEELAAECASSDDKDDNARIEACLDEHEKEELAAECASSDDSNDDVKASSSFLHPLDDHGTRYSLEKQPNVSGQMSEGKELLFTTTLQPIVPEKNAGARSLSEDFKQHYRKEDSLCSTGSEYSVRHSQAVEYPKGLVLEATLPKVENHADNASEQTSRMESDNLKAFTGSVVERSHGLSPGMPTQSSTTQASSSNPSKPVSRFKLHRGSR